MKRLLFTVLACLCFCISLHAQSFTVKGVKADSVKKQTMSYVTVALFDVKTGAQVKSGLTKDNGSFELTVSATKAYKLTIAPVGYNSKTIMLDTLKKVIDLGTLLLTPVTSELKAVSVVAVKPLMKQEVDRLSYDVQADPDSKAMTVLDMLRKVPLITVDATDNIQLKGSGDYKILINGKPSALVARNPADVFKSMPAANIEKIEVITTPPAKYDAEGLAGIINIITKRNADQGYNGSVSARYNNVYGSGANINGTVKQGKFGVVGYLGYNDQKTQRTTSSREQYFVATKSVLRQDADNSFKYKGRYGSLELSYELDSLNLLTGSFNIYGGENTNGSGQFSNQTDATGGVIQRFNLLSSGYSNYTGYDAGINYQLGFKKNKAQLLTASYRYNQSPEESYSQVLAFNRNKYKIPDYQQYNNAGSDEHTLQLDYAHPLKTLTIEGGAKAILRGNFSEFNNNTLDAATGIYVNDPAQTNNFDYQQNVYSIYNSYQLKLSKWSFKAGLRVEHTTVDAQFISSGSSVNQDYNNFVPSFSIQRMFKGSSLNFGFTDRISRPGIYQLNPFVDKTNPRFQSSGNPNLRPVVSHSITLNYSKFAKVTVNGGLSFNFVNNNIQRLSTLQSDTLTIASFQNIGRNRNLGSNLNISYPITPNLNFSINGQLSYIWIKGSYNGLDYSNRGLQGNSYLSGSYKFGNGWRASLNAYAYTPFVSLQGRSNPYYSSSYSLSKELLKKKLTITASASNPYSKYLNTTSYVNSPDFTQISRNQNLYSNFGISAYYKFGGLNSSIKKNQRGISNDDVSGGKNQ
jgi:outer membrane receptor protein involved in Fe transport